MSGFETSAAVEASFLAACRAELAAIKPGNVHIHAPGHAMDAATFECAALAAAPIIADPARPIGRRILDATRASFGAAGCNANLGIVLLTAPLARAFETSPDPSPEALREALASVLAGFTPQDAADVFAAIAHASPGGLGEDDTHDVRMAPTIPLLEAMRLSADKDLIARQYVTGFADIFEIGLPALQNTSAPICDHPALGPAFAIYLTYATRFPDSHIGRKFGEARAEAVRERFAAFAAPIPATADTDSVAADAFRFDAELKAEGVNPGTSADLTVATLFVIDLLQPAFFPHHLRNRPRDD
ncbi:ATP:dephospho-CoA triphosphoribosyl transferase [Fulvimarina pelagi HTCC2506]|uniref:ATP:dephospho-CoA triphosphoribosyl transferase n=1 Tax=Fulvimarina pelagi HTCC2506 TaxID=314231 RepID=Q0G4J5_9HYPH|nr:triphosphoribosyl-dephospho-CoA synthase [Fulvimarina pelagi]EAU41486.1 ATP:dephospho-CoA triphosphoribosyl transferase [Fulvimarina pelagi HTCC2506]